ncbi:uncharacterized protein [Miscanthus floridulus]|uniref:uncharacterized protein n=1 Tax=Miscanthus floridulus TaxID=154761 RepID=UPI0034595354
MEIALLEQVNGHQGPHPAGDVGPSTDIGMGKAALGDLDVNVNSLETDGTGLIKQPEPCAGDTFDLSTATDKQSEIMDHISALIEQRRKDKEVVVQFDDDLLIHLEPWKLPLHKQRYWATNMLDLHEKTLEGGFWKEADFRANRYGERMQFMGLSRFLEFYEKDGNKTRWCMLEFIDLRVSDEGHVFVVEAEVLRHVYQLPNEFLNSNTSRINGVTAGTSKATGTSSATPGASLSEDGGKLKMAATEGKTSSSAEAGQGAAARPRKPSPESLDLSGLNERKGPVWPKSLAALRLPLVICKRHRGGERNSNPDCSEPCLEATAAAVSSAILLIGRSYRPRFLVSSLYIVNR